jgi:hypothetical protein
MKKYLVLAAAVFCSIVFFACSKGDAGPAGLNGPNTATVVFQNGVSPAADYAGCIDTYVRSTSVDTNYNGSGFLLAGRSGGNAYRTFIKFDVSYIIPTNVTVVGAYLDFSDDSESGSNTIRAYALDKDFVEDQATWNSYSTGNLWTAPGGDFSATEASQPIVISATEPFRITLSASVVQSWINSPAANHGLLFKADNETTPENWVRYDCQEDGATGPKLTINYTLP